MAVSSPQSLMQKTRRSSKYNGHIPTHSGLSFNVLDPKPSLINIEDITYGLAYKFRFGGQIGPMTVAEHCVLVSRIIEIMWPKSGAIMAGFLHDACEAYTHDIQATVRDFLSVTLPNGDVIPWTGLERMVNQAVSKALSDGVDFYSYPEVRAADLVALAIEKSHFPTIRDEKWNVPAIPEELAHLVVEYWTPEVAVEKFTARYNEIVATLVS